MIIYEYVVSVIKKDKDDKVVDKDILIDGKVAARDLDTAKLKVALLIPKDVAEISQDDLEVLVQPFLGR